jgi:hypothetical protein
MCYSLEASFAAGSALAIVGFGAVKKALRHDRSMLLFSLFPVIFSLHQFVEGFVWHSVRDATGDTLFRHVYIGIAILLWPLLTPLAAAVAETDPLRKRLHSAFCVSGFVLAGYLTIKLANADGIDVQPIRHSLNYFIHFDAEPPMAVAATYAAVTVIPLLIFRDRIINLFGALVGAAFFYSIVETRQAWFSVWCFTAAVFSVVLFFAIRLQEEKGGFRRPPGGVLFRF